MESAPVPPPPIQGLTLCSVLSGFAAQAGLQAALEAPPGHSARRLGAWCSCLGHGSCSEHLPTAHLVSQSLGPQCRVPSTGGDPARNPA